MAGNEIKVWFNGTPVLDDTGRNEYLSVHRRVYINLEKGWNRLLIKSGTRIQLRITDQEGHPFDKEKLLEETGFKLHAPPKKPGRTWELLATESAYPGTNLELALKAMGRAILQANSHNTRSDRAVAAAPPGGTIITPPPTEIPGGPPGSRADPGGRGRGQQASRLDGSTERSTFGGGFFPPGGGGGGG